MAILIYIKKDKTLNVNKQILNYLNSDFIYLPYDSNFKLKIKSNDSVYKDDIILTKDDINIFSPVSGKVLGSCEMQVGETKQKTVVIENDFREKSKSVKGVKKYFNNYTKTDVLTMLKVYNIISKPLDGKILIINGMDDEVYVATRSYIIGQYTNEILETIDALYQIFNINKCFFTIKNNDSENVDELVNNMGTYPNIDLKLMPDLYPLGKKEVLIEELIIPKKQEEGIIYLAVEDVYAIYNILKRSRPITEKLITISGNALTKQKVVNVKIGSSLKDILINNFKIKTDDYKIVVNGLLSGYEIDTLDFVITENIKSIFITTTDEQPEKDCINCGLCHTKCPVGCDPRNNFKMEKCIKCRTCFYVCPSKIRFKKVG